MSSIGSAPLPREPYAGLPDLPEFTLTSTDIQDGGTAPEWMRSALFGVPGGQDRSPQLSWSGFPEGTKSFVLTCFDPDAPVPSGFWHWTLSNIPTRRCPDAPQRRRGGGLPGRCASGWPRPAPLHFLRHRRGCGEARH